MEHQQRESIFIPNYFDLFEEPRGSVFLIHKTHERSWQHYKATFDQQHHSIAVCFSVFWRIFIYIFIYAIVFEGLFQKIQFNAKVMTVTMILGK